MTSISTDIRAERRSNRSILLEKMRPETAAGGFARDDGVITFYTRVNALLEPAMTVVDLGAGRGSKLIGEPNFARRLIRLQGKVEKVIGIDVDDAIADHPFLDERHVVGPSDPYPLAAGSVDMVVSDWVLEHVADPEAFAREIWRVLKPGGWFCARTPNRWSYIGIAASLIPNRLHATLMARLWPERHSVDVFPTVYRLNTRGAVRRHFEAARWKDCGYNLDAVPKYHANNRVLFTLFDIVHKLTPSAMKTEMIILLQKRS